MFLRLVNANYQVLSKARTIYNEGGYIVRKHGKIVWKHGPYIIDIFVWTWNIWDDRTENTSKQWKMVALERNWLVKMTLRLF